MIDNGSANAREPSKLIRSRRSEMGLAALSGVVLLVSVGGADANAACSAPPGALSSPAPDWGPAAVCAGVSVGTSITTAITTLDTAFLTQTSAFIGAPSSPSVDQMGGGIWIRGVGGTNTVNSVGTGNITSGLFTGDSRSRLNFGGVEAGVDIGRFNLGASGADLYVGVIGGVVTADDKELTEAGQYNFTVPFAGIYTALTWGGWFVDAQLRGDFYSIDATNAFVGLSNQTFHGDAVTISSSTGYKFDFGSFFVEPSAGVIWTRLSLNSLGVVGGGPFGAPPGTYDFDTIDSLLGRLGVRFGTSLQSGNVALQPFATASVWNEFAGNATSTFNPLCTGCVPLNLDTTRIGTYGQFGLGLAAQVLNTGWLGYVRADYRTGENIEGWDVTGGLRYQFVLEVPHSPPPLITK